MPFFFILQAANFPYTKLQMADKWDCISCILERDNREFQKAMRTQVGTTFCCTVNSSKMEFLKVFTGTGIIAQYIARKEPMFETISVPECYYIFYKD